jgi:hypothetical protein
MTSSEPPPRDELGEQLLILTQQLSMLVNELHSTSVIKSFYHRVQFWASLFSALTFSLGGALAFGGKQRVSSNAYWVVTTFGGHWVWGLAFMLASAFTFLCCWCWHRVLQASLLIQAGLFGMIALSFFIASARYLDANLTATPVYAWIMVMHVFLADYARREFK